jgi:Rad3-related DNA helicase
MILADRRFVKSDKQKKFPSWIKDHLKSEFNHLSVDVCITYAKEFYKKMGQPYTTLKTTYKT